MLGVTVITPRVCRYGMANDAFVQHRLIRAQLLAGNAQQTALNAFNRITFKNPEKRTFHSE